MKFAARIALLVLFLTPILSAQLPQCRSNCGPPTPNGIAPTSAAQAASTARGTGGPAVAASKAGRSINILGSESYTYAVPLFSIPGRGLGLNLALYYNSLIWTFNRDNSTMVLGADFDTPSPGFRLGYGLVRFASDLTLGILTEPSGAKHLITPTGATNQYQTTDSTYILVQYPSTTGGPVIATYKSGTRVFFQPFTVLANNTT